MTESASGRNAAHAAACPVSRRSSQRSGRAPHPAARRGPPAAAGDARRRPPADRRGPLVGRRAARLSRSHHAAEPRPHRPRRRACGTSRAAVPEQHVPQPRDARHRGARRPPRHRRQRLPRPDARPVRLPERRKLDPRRAAVVHRRAAGRAQRGLLLGRLRDPVERRRGDLPQGALRHRRRRGREGASAPRLDRSASGGAAASPDVMVARRRLGGASRRSRRAVGHRGDAELRMPRSVRCSRGSTRGGCGTT